MNPSSEELARRFSPEVRRKVLGCSELAAAIGMSPWQESTPYDVWREKMGYKHRVQNEQMARGHWMESIIIERFERECAITVLDRQAEFKHPDRDWLVYHTDGIIRLEQVPPAWLEWWPDEWDIGDLGPGVVEVKAPGSHMARKMIEEGLGKDYIVQIQGGLSCTEYLWGVGVVLDYDSNELHYLPFAANRSTQSRILTRADEFWNFVETKTEPPRSIPTPVDIPFVDLGEMMDLSKDADYVRIAQLYAQAKQQKAVAKVDIDVLREELKPIMMQREAGLAIGAGMRTKLTPGKIKEKIRDKDLMAFCREQIPNFASDHEEHFIERKLSDPSLTVTFP